jgi:hypothetical protein
MAMAAAECVTGTLPAASGSPADCESLELRVVEEASVAEDDAEGLEAYPSYSATFGSPTAGSSTPR